MKTPDYCFLIDGELKSAEDSPGLLTSGLSFGDGLFESMRMLKGRIPFISDHITRLKEGMSVLKIEIPDHYSVEYFSEQAQHIVQKSQVGPNARVRLMVYRQGRRGLPPASNQPGWVMEATPLEHSKFRLNSKGWEIGLYKKQTKPVTSLSNYKTNNYLVSVLASIDRQQRQLDECLLMNDREEVIEGIASNLFARFEDELYTPPLKKGCVAGVMRKQIMELCPLPIRKQAFPPDLLKKADEIFCTNAVRGVRWVQSFQGREYPNDLSKNLTERLNRSIEEK